MNASTFSLLVRLWAHLGRRKHYQFKLLILLMLFSSLAETLSIGAVLPFLGALISPDQIFESPFFKPVIQVLGVTKPNQLIFPLTLFFCFAVLFAGTIRIILLWASTKLSFSTGSDISINIYRRTLYQPFIVHCSRNSSEIISGIITKTGGTISVINSTLTLVSSTLTFIAILATLIVIDPYVALLTFFSFSIIYLLIIIIVRKHIERNSKYIAKESTSVIQSLQEGLGGIRDVLMDGAQEIYCKIYRSADLRLRRAQGNNSFIASCPRYFTEVFAMIIIAVVSYMLILYGDGVSGAIPILGALALGAQRLLPMLQQTYGAVVIILGGKNSLQDTLELLEQKLPNNIDQSKRVSITFNNSIILNNISFRYNESSPFIFKNLNLTINKGSCVGIIGTTGSGKSTLLDITMGLLSPTEGLISVDNQVITSENNYIWQSLVAHVPQTIFLTDGTVEENIAFSVPKDQIDHKRLKMAAELAQIADTIESWPKQYKTFVGERGVRLSGGQRQRIGIARALYKQSEVIIFDEATSALDNKTEENIINGIESLSKKMTILMIAHRITTLKNCSQIIELENGLIKRVGSYRAIFS